MRVSWIEHKGKKILFEDYTGLSGDELLEVLYESEKVFKTLTSPVPVLLDYTGAYADQNYMNELKRLGKEYDSLIERTASVGVTEIKKVLAAAYLRYTGQGHKAGYFDDLEDAKDFLVDPSSKPPPLF